MTERERQELEAKAAARAAVLAKFPDPAAVLEDDDFKHLSGPEVVSLINAGRVPGIGPDKRLNRR